MFYFVQVDAEGRVISILTTSAIGDNLIDNPSIIQVQDEPSNYYGKKWNGTSFEDIVVSPSVPIITDSEKIDAIFSALPDIYALLGGS